MTIPWACWNYSIKDSVCLPLLPPLCLSPSSLPFPSFLETLSAISSTYLIYYFTIPFSLSYKSFITLPFPFYYFHSNFKFFNLEFERREGKEYVGAVEWHFLFSLFGKISSSIILFTLKGKKEYEGWKVFKNFPILVKTPFYLGVSTCNQTFSFLAIIIHPNTHYNSWGKNVILGQTSRFAFWKTYPLLLQRRNYLFSW